MGFVYDGTSKEVCLKELRYRFEVCARYMELDTVTNDESR